MRKSVWLLSAAIVTFASPAVGQSTSQSTTDSDKGAAQPTQSATEGAAVQDQATEPAPANTGDIVITATRRNQALSDVPMAVSAVTAQQLEYTGASDIRQLNQVAPSLLVSSTSSEAGAGVARIRGIGTVGDNPGLESSVGVFIDGVYRSRAGVALTELGPLDRIEVLRGPQGTLFGRNTSAGLISIITAKPKFRTEVGGQVDIGNYDMRRVELSLNAPLGDTIAARVDGVYLKRDGFLKDDISGRRVNDRDRWMVRGQALFQPNDDLSIRLIADYSKRDEECCAAPYLRAHDTVASGGSVIEAPSTIATIERGLGAIINDDPFHRHVSITPGRSYRSDVKDYGLSGELVYDFGGAELTSITAYRFNKYIRGQDADFNNLDILYRDDDGSAFNRFKTFSEEVRLQGNAFGDRLDWLVGGYFANEKLRLKDNLAYGNDYARYANCLVANSFAQALIASGVPAVQALGQGLVQPGAAGGGTCFNQATSGAIVGLLPAAQQGVFRAFARLTPFNTTPPFVNSGFANLTGAATASLLSLNGTALDDLYDQSSNNWALFTHNIFSITDRLKLTVGARYTHERKKLDADLADNNTLCTIFSGGPLASLQTLPCVSPSVPGGALSLSDSRTESKLSGTVVLSYKPTDQLLTYLSYARGYKAGGFNLDRSALWRATSAAGTPPLSGNGAICVTTTQAGCQGIIASGADLQFKPETNDAFEAGAKYNGRGFDINLAVFHQLFKNFQLNTFNGLNFIVENVNSCDEDLTPDGADEDNDPRSGACGGHTRAGVKSYGFELEAFTRPLPDLQVNGGIVMANTKYRHNLVGANGRPLTNALFQLPGRRISNSSEWTGTASIAWTPPIGNSGMRALFYLDGRLTTSYNTGSDLDIEKRQGGFSVFNGRIGVHGPGDGWAIEFWGQNLLDEDFLQVAFDAPIQGGCTTRGAVRGFCAASTSVPNRATQLYGAFLGEPRTFGVTLRAKWSPPPAAPAYVAPPAPPPPPPAPPPTQTCPDGSVILATDACPAPPPPPPPPPPAPERGK
ncbi:MAG TPA: TonB-dependent receptor [Sphingomicrobium sp.]